MARFFTFSNGSFTRGVNAVLMSHYTVVQHGVSDDKDVPTFIKVAAEHPINAMKEIDGVHSVCLADGTLSLAPYNNGKVAVIGQTGSRSGNTMYHTLVSISSMSSWLMSTDDTHLDGDIVVTKGSPTLVAFGMDKNPLVLKRQPGLKVPSAAYIMGIGDKIEVSCTDGSVYEIRCFDRGKISIRCEPEEEEAA